MLEFDERVKNILRRNGGQIGDQVLTQACSGPAMLIAGEVGRVGVRSMTVSRS